MNAQTAIIHDMNTVSKQITIADIKTTAPLKKKKTMLRITAVRVKLFFWNLSPLHWYDDFKVMQINMDEFICKKITDKNNS